MFGMFGILDFWNGWNMMIFWLQSPRAVRNEPKSLLEVGPGGVSIYVYIYIHVYRGSFCHVSCWTFGAESVRRVQHVVVIL